MSTLELKFEDDLDYQQEAVQRVVDLFKGQEDTKSKFTTGVPNG